VKLVGDVGKGDGERVPDITQTFNICAEETAVETFLQNAPAVGGIEILFSLLDTRALFG
jgi:hypothetical protein